MKKTPSAMATFGPVDIMKKIMDLASEVTIAQTPDLIEYECHVRLLNGRTVSAFGASPQDAGMNALRIILSMAHQKITTSTSQPLDYQPRRPSAPRWKRWLLLLALILAGAVALMLLWYSAWWVYFSWKYAW